MYLSVWPIDVTFGFHKNYVKVVTQVDSLYQVTFFFRTFSLFGCFVDLLRLTRFCEVIQRIIFFWKTYPLKGTSLIDRPRKLCCTFCMVSVCLSNGSPFYLSSFILVFIWSHIVPTPISHCFYRSFVSGAHLQTQCLRLTFETPVLSAYSVRISTLFWVLRRDILLRTLRYLEVQCSVS